MSPMVAPKLLGTIRGTALTKPECILVVQLFFMKRPISSLAVTTRSTKIIKVGTTKGLYAAALVVLIASIAALVGLTTNSVRSNLKYGVEFKGGYELRYKVGPKPGHRAATELQVQNVARTLQARANSQGVAEPQVQLLGRREIDVKLAGAFNRGKARVAIGKSSNLPVHLQEEYSRTVGGVLSKADLHNILKTGLIALLATFFLLLMRSIKDAIDPLGLMNPGKVL